MMWGMTHWSWCAWEEWVPVLAHPEESQCQRPNSCSVTPPTYIPACHTPSPCCLLSSPCTNLSGMPSCTLTWMPHISVNTPSSSSPSMGGCVASRTSATISNASVLQLHLLASELFFFLLSFHWHISRGGAIHATHWQDLVPVLGQCGCVTYAPEILFFLFTYDCCTAGHVTSPVLFLLL